MPKNANYYTMALISHASKVMLKILQARLQQFVNQELPDVQAGFRKGRGTRGQIANLHWIRKKQGNSRKTSTSASLTVLKPLTVWITTNCEKFLKRWEYQTTLPASCETCMQVKKQQLEPDMKQWYVWFKTGKGVCQDYILSTCLFNLFADLEKEMKIYFSILTWRIPWTKESCRLQSMGTQSRTQNGGLDDA